MFRQCSSSFMSRSFLSKLALVIVNILQLKCLPSNMLKAASPYKLEAGAPLRQLYV